MRLHLKLLLRILQLPRILSAVYEAITERLYRKTFAMDLHKCGRDALALRHTPKVGHADSLWQPGFHDLQCDGLSAVASDGSSTSAPPSPAASVSLSSVRSSNMHTLLLWLLLMTFSEKIQC